MIVLLCGLSGAGKTTIGNQAKKILTHQGYKVEVIDGDEYRKTLCSDLGFSKENRIENIRRLGFVASKFSKFGIISLITAIVPYKESRDELKKKYANVQTVFIDCDLPTLIQRDTKGFYRKALLPEGHPQKVHNLTGVNDHFDIPSNPDLHIITSKENIDESVSKLTSFITNYYTIAPRNTLSKWSFRYI